MEINKPNKIIIGLSGPIASGKDVVATFLNKQGYNIIDVDKIGHEALEKSKKDIIQLFNPIAKKKNIILLDKDNNLIRKNLGKIVFANKKNLLKHEALLHPKMNSLIEERVQSSSSEFNVINAAILHKFEIIKSCDIVLFITANPFIRFFRAKKRSNISLTQFFKTFLSQIEIYSKCKKLNADIYKVDNSSTSNVLYQKIEIILKSYIKKG